jgi:transcriptional antiterminator RfaH
VSIYGGAAAHHWYALRVKSNREKIVSTALECKGYERFLPLYRVQRRWSDRLKDVELPLFAGYVFCRMDPMRRLPVLTIPGVLSLVGTTQTPLPVADQEIAALQTIAGAGIPTAPWPFLQAGQRVRIERGALRDLEGLLVEVKNQFRVVVSVSLLQRSVSVEVDRDSIRPLSVQPRAKQAVAS